jgi:hypothetical protein
MLPSRVRVASGPDPSGNQPFGIELRVVALTRALNPD